MRWSLGRRLGAGFALPLLILMAVGALAYRTLEGSTETSRSVEHAYQVLDALGDLERMLSEAESWQRGYLISGEESLLQAYQAEIARIPGQRQRVSDLSVDADQRRRLAALGPMIDARLERMKRRAELRRTSSLEATERALPTSEGQKVMNQIRERIAEMDGEQRQLLKERSEANESTTALTERVIVWGTILGFLVVAAAGFFLTRSLTGPILSGVQGIASSASEILAATMQQATGAQEEATAIQETSTTIHEVKQTAQLASQKAQAVAELARKTVQTSQDGRRSAEETLRGMQEAKARMEGIAQRVLGLSEQGQAIGEIIASVNDIAEQSNLLAVNAAIEAAKAGDAGRGFAVVASEVKALAEQSKQATAQVRQILGEIQRATQAAVLATEQGVKASEAGEGLARQAGDSIVQLSQSLAESAQAAQQILATAQEQSAGVDQVAIAMDNIQQVSIQNRAATRQMERAARDLNELAHQFRAVVAGSPNGFMAAKTGRPATEHEEAGAA